MVVQSLFSIRPPEDPVWGGWNWRNFSFLLRIGYSSQEISSPSSSCSSAARRHSSADAKMYPSRSRRRTTIVLRPLSAWLDFVTWSSRSLRNFCCTSYTGCWCLLSFILAPSGMPRDCSSKPPSTCLTKFGYFSSMKPSDSGVTSVSALKAA